MRRLPIAIALALLGLACHRGTPTDPTAPVALGDWSPYLGIHPYDWHMNRQQPYLLPLLERGKVRGIRLDAKGPATAEVTTWFMANGADDILAIFPNEYLAQPDVTDRFDAMARMHPYVRYWEVGNEVDLFIELPPEQYVPIFIGLYRHAQQHHPDLVIIPQASLGGAGGDASIRHMLDAGILGLARDPDPATRLRIFSVHYYSTGSTYLPGAKRQIERLPADVEVWVTEAGFNGAAGQVDFVRTEYPRIRSMLRATRIYWYVFTECTDFSLVRGLAPQCLEDPPVLSPLYQQLTHGGVW